MVEPPAAPKLYLITPPVADAASVRPAIEAALDGSQVAALLIRFATAGGRERADIVTALAPLAQKRGVAVLVEDDVAAATRGGADGVHVTGGIAAIKAALEQLKPERIVGAGNLRSRHEAMEAAEAGVDYVMFGEPSGGRPPPPLAAVAERAAWWAEVFEAPGVAFAPDAEAEKRLARTGIEFVARELGERPATQDADRQC